MKVIIILSCYIFYLKDYIELHPDQFIIVKICVQSFDTDQCLYQVGYSIRQKCQRCGETVHQGERNEGDLGAESTASGS